jgi:hypothetical protein
MSGVNRRRHPGWCEDPIYAEEYARALQFFGQRLVQEAVRRAYEGEFELVLDKNSRPVFVWIDPTGQVVREDTGDCREVALWKNKKDSTLLMFLIKQWDSTYRDNAKVVLLNSDDPSSLTDEQLNKLADQLTKAAR